MSLYRLDPDEAWSLTEEERFEFMDDELTHEAQSENERLEDELLDWEEYLESKRNTSTKTYRRP